MDLELVIKDGPHAGARLALPRDKATCLGNQFGDADLQLHDPSVSRRHAIIELRGDVCLISDLKSLNGTAVNDEPVGEGQVRRLVPGDTLLLGKTSLELTDRSLPLSGSAERQPAGPRAHSSSVKLVKGGATPEGAIRKRFRTGDTDLVPEPERAKTDQIYRERLERQLNAIFRMGNLINAERDLDVILAIAADSVLQVSGGARSAILMLDEDTGELVERAVRTRADLTGADEFSVSRSIVEETLRSGLSLLTTDAGHDQRFTPGESIFMQGVKELMSVPVRTLERSTGVIYVDTLGGHETFAESDMHLLSAIGHQLGMAVERARLVADLEAVFVGAIRALVRSVEPAGRCLAGHSERVTSCARMIAEEMGLSPEHLAEVELAALLHDLGMGEIPEEILSKAGALSDEEETVVRRHPAHSVDLIKRIDKIERVARMERIIDAVLHHHERYDGGGYPDGLDADEISVTARILAVADTYDAVISDRPYRETRSPEAAVEVLRECAGTQLDPMCVGAFLAVFRDGGLESGPR